MRKLSRVCTLLGSVLYSVRIEIVFENMKFIYKFKQECIPVGCVLSAAVAVCWVGGGGVCRGSVCLGVSAWGGSAQGVSAWWGCTHPPRGQTDTCENITFPQLLLRTVIKVLLWEVVGRQKGQTFMLKIRSKLQVK